jgi:hypothetical protein
MEIPVIAVYILGIGACLKYVYQIAYKKNIKNIGTFVAILYLTMVYADLAFEPQIDYVKTSPFIRVGITIIFLDQMISFIYELILEILKRKSSESLIDLEDRYGSK